MTSVPWLLSYGFEKVADDTAGHSRYAPVRFQIHSIRAYEEIPIVYIERSARAGLQDPTVTVWSSMPNPDIVRH